MQRPERSATHLSTRQAAKAGKLRRMHDRQLALLGRGPA